MYKAAYCHECIRIPCGNNEIKKAEVSRLELSAG